MRVIHVVPSVDDEASGPSYCVVRLCEISHRDRRGCPPGRTGVESPDEIGPVSQDIPSRDRSAAAWQVTRDAPVAGRRGHLRAIRPHSQSQPVDDAERLLGESVPTLFELPPHGVSARNTLGLGARLSRAAEEGVLAPASGPRRTRGRMLSRHKRRRIPGHSQTRTCPADLHSPKRHRCAAIAQAPRRRPSSAALPRTYPSSERRDNVAARVEGDSASLPRLGVARRRPG